MRVQLLALAAVLALAGLAAAAGGGDLEYTSNGRRVLLQTREWARRQRICGAKVAASLRPLFLPPPPPLPVACRHDHAGPAGSRPLWHTLTLHHASSLCRGLANQRDRLLVWQQLHQADHPAGACRHVPIRREPNTARCLGTSVTITLLRRATHPAMRKSKSHAVLATMPMLPAGHPATLQRAPATAGGMRFATYRYNGGWPDYSQYTDVPVGSVSSTRQDNVPSTGLITYQVGWACMHARLSRLVCTIGCAGGAHTSCAAPAML